MGQKLVSFDAAGNIVAYYDTIDSPAPEGATVIEVSDEQWKTCISTPGYVVRDNELVPPEAPSQMQLLTLAKTAQLTSIASAYEGAVLSGFESSALGAAHTYSTTPTDRHNLCMSCVVSVMPNRSADWLAKIWCADPTGAWALADHTPAQLEQLVLDERAFSTALAAKKADLYRKIADANDVESVLALTWA
ncbi:hypothetical protein [Burkholderia vietnamiensis]|uniref:hypothetical protein n=1 Tax=Burkholderia vietnamiensis TaxID=60552 RepID=UPI00158A14EA|nr:hypothetical protein [Burkholderia vietnamiensis]